MTHARAGVPERAAGLAQWSLDGLPPGPTLLVRCSAGSYPGRDKSRHFLCYFIYCKVGQCCRAGSVSDSAHVSSYKFRKVLNFTECFIQFLSFSKVF